MRVEKDVGIEGDLALRRKMSVIIARRLVIGRMSVQTVLGGEGIGLTTEAVGIDTVEDVLPQAPAEAEAVTAEDTEAEIAADTGEEEKDLHRPTPDPDQISRFLRLFLSCIDQEAEEGRGNDPVVSLKKSVQKKVEVRNSLLRSGKEIGRDFLRAEVENSFCMIQFDHMNEPNN